MKFPFIVSFFTYKPNCTIVVIKKSPKFWQKIKKNYNNVTILYIN